MNKKIFSMLAGFAASFLMIQTGICANGGDQPSQPPQLLSAQPQIQNPLNPIGPNPFTAELNNSASLSEDGEDSAGIPTPPMSNTESPIQGGLLGDVKKSLSEKSFPENSLDENANSAEPDNSSAELEKKYLEAMSQLANNAVIKKNSCTA